jgi:hypothetical protein
VLTGRRVALTGRIASKGIEFCGVIGRVTAGPAAMGGLALVTVGALFLVLALLCAIVGLFQPVASYRDRSSGLAVTRFNLGDHQEAREERWNASYPKE